MGRVQGPLPPPKLLQRSPWTAHLFPGGWDWEIKRPVANHMTRTSPWDQEKKLEQLRGPREPNGQGPGPPPPTKIASAQPMERPPLSGRLGLGDQATGGQPRVPDFPLGPGEEVGTAQGSQRAKWAGSRAISPFFLWR